MDRDSIKSGSWRLEDRYPPSDTVELGLELGSQLTNVGGGTTVWPDASTGPIWE